MIPNDPAQEEQKEQVEAAQTLVEKVEGMGDVDKLMTAKQVSAWKKRYNDINNEGGDGFIPHRISKEDYERALKILDKERA